MSELDPRQTIITLPDAIPWESYAGAPAQSLEQATLFGNPAKSGTYLVLMRWFPGFMSAPHHYATDRLCVVVSGVWWCNSGPDFDPYSTVPAYPGSYVRRVANTPHYDGVRRTTEEPAVIAITGRGPIEAQWVDPSQPIIRAI